MRYSSNYSGVLSAMSAMVNLEIPWINIMSKMDLVTSRKNDSSSSTPRNGLRRRKDVARWAHLSKIFHSCRARASLTLSHIVLHRFLDPDPMLLSVPYGGAETNPINPRFHALNQAIVQLVSIFTSTYMFHR